MGFFLLWLVVSWALMLFCILVLGHASLALVVLVSGGVDDDVMSSFGSGYYH